LITKVQAATTDF